MTLNNNSPTDNLIREKWVDAPERIWLQHDPENVAEGFPPADCWEHVTWCSEAQYDSDVAYIREDIHRAQADRDRAHIEVRDEMLRRCLRIFEHHGLGGGLSDDIRAALANTASDRDKPDA